MNLVRCEKGHFYDKDKNGDHCPYCAQMASAASSAPSPAPAAPAPGASAPAQTASAQSASASAALLLLRLLLLSPIQLLLQQLPHRTRRQGLQFLLLNPSSLSPLRGLPLLSHPALPLRYRQQRRRPDRRLPQIA